MSKLLERAKVKLENAKNNRKKIEQNDAYLDDSCYNVQQSIEFTLKYLVEMSGENYIENHDIRAQLGKLSGIIDAAQMDKLKSMAVTLNSWEAESRYSDNFLATIEELDAAINIAEELIIKAKKYVLDITENTPPVNEDIDAGIPIKDPNRNDI